MRRTSPPPLSGLQGPQSSGGRGVGVAAWPGLFPWPVLGLPVVLPVSSDISHFLFSQNLRAIFCLSCEVTASAGNCRCDTTKCFPKTSGILSTGKQGRQVRRVRKECYPYALKMCLCSSRVRIPGHIEPEPRPVSETSLCQLRVFCCRSGPSGPWRQWSVRQHVMMASPTCLPAHQDIGGGQPPDARP